MKLFKNKFLTFSIIGGVIVFAVIAFVLLSITATTKAVVLNADGSAGTTITASMVTEIEVPKDTPGEFYRTKNSLIGERLTSNVKKNQLIYKSDLMSSTSAKLNNDKHPTYVTTTIRVPDDNAVGGMLAAGDVVDVSVVPKDGDVASLAKALPAYSIDTSLNGGVYFLLSNVKILDSTTAVSATNGSNLTSAQGGNKEEAKKQFSNANSKGSYYLISVSYDDFKKLRIAEQFGSLFLSLAPAQNKDSAPMLDSMNGGVVSGLVDAEKGTPIVDKTKPTIEKAPVVDPKKAPQQK